MGGGAGQHGVATGPCTWGIREWGREEKTTHRSHHLVRQEPDSIRAEGDDQRTLILNLNFVFLGPLEPRAAGASPRGGAGCPLTSDGGNLQRCKT